MTSAGIMPRFAWICALLVGAGACSFDASYTGHYTCRDGKCPQGYVCTTQKVCIPSQPGDAAIDARPIDARTAALTCSDPGLFPAAGGTAMGSTGAPRANTVSASCGGVVMNGPDAVYRIDLASTTQLTISLTASYAASAYVLAPCTLAPQTPTCETDTAAAPGNPLVLSAAAGSHYIVVDNPNPTLSGTYTLTVQ